VKSIIFSVLQIILMLFQTITLPVMQPLYHINLTNTMLHVIFKTKEKWTLSVCSLKVSFLMVHQHTKRPFVCHCWQKDLWNVY